MSTLRLDNYVYTEEGIRAAWCKVADDGHLTIAISCYAGGWFFERLYYTIQKATGVEPVAVQQETHASVTFIVPKPGAKLTLPAFCRDRLIVPFDPIDQVHTTSDDWPFLYINPDSFPWGYLLVLSYILAVTVLLVRPVFGLGTREARLDWPLFLMGAAFMLIEARGVTGMSLLFGSTWVVNAAIFAGILLMVLLANQVVQLRRLKRPGIWFAALFASVLFLWVFPVGWLNTLPLLMRGLIGGVITGLPIGLAGLIVPIFLARSANPAASLGSNLLGAVLGGCLEYYSMVAGLRATALIALALYVLAFLIAQRRGQSVGGTAG